MIIGTPKYQIKTDSVLVLQTTTNNLQHDEVTKSNPKRFILVIFCNL